ncbi:MAG: TonB-dependent receptor [Chitinophagaceae bacterium]
MLRRLCLTSVIAFSFLVANSQSDSIEPVNRLLNLSLEELMEVKVITASGFLQSTFEAPSTIVVITAKQIAERGYEQLEDALRDVPGIDMIHINGYAPTLFYFRGMYGAENLRALLMIDGIVENNIIGSNDMAGPVYSLHSAERIEIIWGPVSALYGSNAFGGIIHIISKKGKDIDGIKAEQGFGSFNTSFTKISAGTRKKNLEFSVGGTLYNSDGPVFKNRDPQYSGSFVHKGYSFNGIVTYHAKFSSTTLGYRTYRTPMGFGTYANSPTVYLRLPAAGDANDGTVGIMSREFRGERSGLDDAFLRTYYLQHEYNSGKKINFTARVFYRETGTGDESYAYITTDGRRMIRARVATFSNRSAGEFVLNYNPGGRHHFTAGAQFQQDNVEAGARQSTVDLTTVYLVDGRDTVLNLNSSFLPRRFDIRNNLGSFAHYNYALDLLGRTYLTAGFRYDRNSYFGDAFSPRATIVNRSDSNFTFKFQFGKAFRAPSNLEIYQAQNVNFNLKQERITTFEINAIYSMGKRMRVQLNGFRNNLSDVIILGNLSGLNPDKNAGVVHINGIEALADLQLNNKISGFINFTFQDSRGHNLVTGRRGRIPGVARVKGNIGFTARVENLLIVSGSGNWIGKRSVPFTDPHGPVDGYFLANVYVSTVPLFKQKITIGFNVHNLFNTTWFDPGIRTADGFLYSTVLEQPGINGLFKIAVGL